MKVSVQVAIPALHVSLGVFFKLLDLFEKAAQQVDILFAMKQSNQPGITTETIASEPFIITSYCIKLQELHKATRIKLSDCFREDGDRGKHACKQPTLKTSLCGLGPTFQQAAVHFASKKSSILYYAHLPMSSNRPVN